MRVNSFETALTFLQGARNPSKGRKIQNNTHVVYAEVEGVPCVGIRLHSTVVVAYLPDGTTVLNSGGWHTVTTQDRINTYSPALVGTDYRWRPDGTKHSEYRTWLVKSAVFARTPERPKPCRRCGGAGVNAAQGRCWGCVGTGVKDYGSKPVCPSFEDGVVVDKIGFVVGYGNAPREWWGRGVPVFAEDLAREYERLQPEHLPVDVRHIADSTRIAREVESTGCVLVTQPSRGMSSIPVISPDAQSVEFSKMSAEAQAEMDEWDLILRGGK